MPWLPVPSAYHSLITWVTKFIGIDCSNGSQLIDNDIPDFIWPLPAQFIVWPNAVQFKTAKRSFIQMLHHVSQLVLSTPSVVWVWGGHSNTALINLFDLVDQRRINPTLSLSLPLHIGPSACINYLATLMFCCVCIWIIYVLSILLICPTWSRVTICLTPVVSICFRAHLIAIQQFSTCICLDPIGLYLLCEYNTQFIISTRQISQFTISECELIQLA